MADERTYISKEEFCKKTHTSDDCWIFKEGNKNLFFFDGTYYYYDDGVKIRRFRDMPEYEEVWFSFTKSDDYTTKDYTIWNRWSIYG